MPAMTTESKFITPLEMSRRMGVTRETVYDWLNEGKGPKHVRIGQRILIAEADFYAWLESKTQQ